MCYDEQNCDWDIAMATEEIDRLRDEIKGLQAIVDKLRLGVLGGIVLLLGVPEDERKLNVYERRCLESLRHTKAAAEAAKE